MSHKQHYTEPPHDQPTAWHRHIPSEEGVPQAEHGSRTRPIALTIAFLVCFGFVGATILATYLYFQVHMAGLRREKIETTYFTREFAAGRDKELARIGDYHIGHDDQARKGIVALPVEQAKQRVLARYSGGAGKQ